ncbi:MAG: M28 family peptidase [Moraxellaceae bacterium]|nr:MAG: M28 family peptidase [Moraxellaceae bacterium]
MGRHRRRSRPIGDADPHGPLSVDQAKLDGERSGRVQCGVRPNVGVDFILWDIEDYGKANDETPHETTWCIGSQYWVKNPPVKGYKPLFAINLDMVGGSNAQFTMDEVSRQYAPTVVQKVWGIADEIGFSKYFINQNSGNLIDDHYWVNQAGIPCIDIVDFNDATGFYKYWHTQFDNLNNIDRNTLKAVGQVVLETIYREKPAA